MPAPFRLSIAIPVHNEETVLPELLRRTMTMLDTVPGGPHEVLFVDDGSTDCTPDMLEEAARLDPRIMVIVLSRNFGHQAALTAALDHITGDATVVMDGDLQDCPEAIPQFVERYHQGYDVVYAQRVNHQGALGFALLLFHLLQNDGQLIGHPAAARLRRLRPDVAARDRMSPTDA